MKSAIKEHRPRHFYALRKEYSTKSNLLL